MINKVDLPSAQTEDVKQQIIELVGCKRANIGQVQKMVGINEIFDAIIQEFLHLWIRMKIKLEH